MERSSDSTYLKLKAAQAAKHRETREEPQVENIYEPESAQALRIRDEYLAAKQVGDEVKLSELREEIRGLWANRGEEAELESPPQPGSQQDADLEKVQRILREHREKIGAGPVEMPAHKVEAQEAGGWETQTEAQRAIQIKAEYDAARTAGDREKVAELKAEIRQMLGMEGAQPEVEAEPEPAEIGFDLKGDVSLDFSAEAMRRVAEDFAGNPEHPAFKRLQDMVGEGGGATLRYVGKGADGLYEFIDPNVNINYDAGESARDYVIKLSAYALEAALSSEKVA
ncbi:MAG: hypothetical protein ABIA47_00475 [bacterium]